MASTALTQQQHQFVVATATAALADKLEAPSAAAGVAATPPQPPLARAKNILACKQWWRTCFLYGGDQEKYYRQIYGEAALRRLRSSTTKEDTKKHTNPTATISPPTDANSNKSEKCTRIAAAGNRLNNPDILLTTNHLGIPNSTHTEEVGLPIVHEYNGFSFECLNSSVTSSVTPSQYVHSGQSYHGHGSPIYHANYP